jgi:hypothetical protein
MSEFMGERELQRMSRRSVSPRGGDRHGTGEERPSAEQSKLLFGASITTIRRQTVYAYKLN